MRRISPNTIGSYVQLLMVLFVEPQRNRVRVAYGRTAVVLTSCQASDGRGLP